MAKAGSTEKVVREIWRHTCRRFSAEEKIRIVLEGLRGEGCLRRSLLIRPPLVVRTSMRAAATRPRQCRRSPQTRAE